MEYTQIRNNPGQSSYFQGQYQGYGRYQWNIKFYGFEAEHEVETAQNWAFGEYSYSTGQFDYLNEVVGRPVKASLQGRSGGWLVVDTELTEAELTKIDEHVKACLKGLSAMLVDERQMIVDADLEAETAELETRASLESDFRIVAALDMIREVAGADAVVVIKGIKLI